MTMTMTMTERVERLDAMILGDRVLRGAWTEGRERACLLAALSPEAGAAADPHACPADVMPEWLARATVAIDDHTSEAEWPRIVRRYAAAARRWHVLDAAAWERVRVAWLATDVLGEALLHVTVDEWGVRAAVEGVQAALRSGRGLAEAARAAQAAARAAMLAARRCGGEARAAAWVARAAARAAAMAAAAEAMSAATAAADAAEEAEAEAAEWAAAQAASWDRMSDALIGRIEAECEGAS